MMIFLVFSCRSPNTVLDTQAEGNVISDTGGVSEPSSTSQDTDIDEDGFVEGVDCDDWDPDIHPDAEEIFDYIDNNCDGIIDLDGVFSGSFSMSAVAIYEGNPYSFIQECTGVLTRERGAASVLISCNIDQTQEKADILLGETLTIEAESTTLHDVVWTEDMLLLSSDGWDTPIATSYTWSSLEEDLGREISVVFQLDSFSLDLVMEGSLFRE
jgi:hypothetical protein